MLKITKTDTHVISSKTDGSDVLEITLTTTYKKETEEGAVERTHSVKTFDTDIDRAYEVLTNAMSAYFYEIREIFNGESNVENKGSEISTA